jgi:hypothetical protein
VTDEVEETEESGPPARRKKGSGKSGWCIMEDADSHERCPISVGYTFVCSCTCPGHGSRKGEEARWISEDLILDLYNPDE